MKQTTLLFLTLISSCSNDNSEQEKKKIRYKRVEKYSLAELN